MATKEMNKLVFLCGVPRSGSTLLANLLAQNPAVHATATSGLLDTLQGIAAICDTSDSYRAMPKDEREERKLAVLRGAISGYFSHAEGKACFDKNRGWPTAFEMMEWVLGHRDKVKAIVCVRDLRDVLASFEKLYRKTSVTRGGPTQPEHLTAVSRADFVLQPDRPVGLAMNAIRDAVTRGWRDHLLFVDYDDVCRKPQAELDKIYQFIGEESFGHDPMNVEQVTHEDDSVHEFAGLHDIRPEVRPQGAQWPSVFDNAVVRTPFWNRIAQGARYWEHM